MLRAESGQLGQFGWWLLPRSADRFITVWQHCASQTWIGHGLLGAGPPGDGRDADLVVLQRSLRQAGAWAAAGGAGWVGEQGPVQPADAPLRQADYWRDLAVAVAAAIDAGGDESAPAQALPGWPAAVSAHAWHALNWQRAWRQVEAERFNAVPRSSGGGRN